MTASYDRTVRVWNALDGQHLFTLSDHDAPIAFMDISSDGRRVATSDVQGFVKVFVTRLPDLLGLAKTRVTRDLTPAECWTYLQSKGCPASQTIGSSVN
jgi:WD40 repeat protein